MNKSLGYYAEKAAEALEKAQEDGVVQIRGQLGRTDGCRCAEGVVADMLVTEGVLEVQSWDGANMRYYSPETNLTAVASLREVLPVNKNLLSMVKSETGSVKAMADWNDLHGLSFGEIAGLVRRGIEEGFYGEEEG